MSVNEDRELKATELELVSGGWWGCGGFAELIVAIASPTPISTDSAKEHLASKQAPGPG